MDQELFLYTSVQATPKISSCAFIYVFCQEGSDFFNLQVSQKDDEISAPGDIQNSTGKG